MKTLLPLRSISGRTLCCLATALLFNSWLMVQAQPNPDNPGRPRPPQGDRQRDNRPDQRMQPGAGVPLMERVLTEEQRESMRDIMKSQREKMQGMQETIRVARKELMKASLAESFDEEGVRAKALVVAKLEADLTVLRAKAISQVQPPLSAEQIERIINPPPQGRLQPRNGEPRPGDRRGDRPPHGPRDGSDQPRPPKRDPQ
jgi:Spy/CpxP family protein refolding chaperone